MRTLGPTGRSAALGIVGLLVAGCGSDGGGGLDPREVAVEELGQLGRILHVSGPLLGHAATAFDPAATPPDACEQGTAIVVNGEGRRQFDYYDIDPVVRFTRYEFDGCRVTADLDGIPAQLEYEGDLVMGATPGDEPSGSTGGDDRYVEFGSNDDALVLKRTIRDLGGVDVIEQATDRISGGLEWRVLDEATEYASVLVRVLGRSIPDGYSLVWLQGEAGEPLRVEEVSGSGAFAVDGPYIYNSSRCTGGSRRITTVQNITREDGYPTGGEIEIERGESVLTILFSAEGAAAQLGDGEAVMLSEDEVRAALDEPLC